MYTIFDIIKGQNPAQMIDERVWQVIIICSISLFSCQFLKFIIFSIKKRRLMLNTLITTGGMPSSHTSVVVTLITSMAIFQYNDNGFLEYSFAVACVFAAIVVHDSMGVRLEASKHATILNRMVEDEDIEKKQKLGFGRSGKLKELLGHKHLEVLGGFIYGLVIGLIFSNIFV